MNADYKKRILILMGRYLPGHKDGGPLRTIINLIASLGKDYAFKVICLDRDHGDTEPYPNIKKKEWNLVGNAQVWYVTGGFSFELIWRNSSEADLVYVCGFYDDYAYKTALLKKLGKISKPVVFASMGVFSKGALMVKPFKKTLYINLCKILGLFKNIIWSVTSLQEKEDLVRVMGEDVKWIIAEDMPRSNVPGFVLRENPFSVVFLSRICPMKNLHYAIRVLCQISYEMKFYIYGPIEDEHYWSLCKEELSHLPQNVRWEYCGDVPSECVQSMLSQHDVFLFPTMGENYGHVIFEALSVGCIPVISDKTPWNEIKDKSAGYVLPLDNIELFTQAIDYVANMPTEKRGKLAERCVEIAKERVLKNAKETGYRKIFDL